MLRKLLSSSARFQLYNKPTAKLSELKEYACLIESLNEEASNKAVQEFQQLAKKYELSMEDLTYLFRVISIEPELLKKYVPYEAWRKEVEFHNYQWRRSNFHVGGQNLQSTIDNLKLKYPEVANYDTRHPERVKAYKTIENIFLKDGPQLKNNEDGLAIKRFTSEFEKRINSHIADLKNKVPKKTVDPQDVHSSKLDVHEVDAVKEISSVLHRVNKQLQSSPAYVYGSIRHFVAVHKNQAGGSEVPKITKPQTSKSLEESATITANAGTEVVGTLEDGNDLPLILEEQNKELRDSLSYNFLPWINDRKLIFEAQADQGNTLIYGALGSLFGAYLLYKLYQGDATNKGLVAVLAASAFCIRRYRVNSFRNSFDYLVQMNVHRDGKNLDLYIQKANKQITKIEGVPVSDFKLHRTDYTFDLPENSVSSLQNQSSDAPKVRLSDFRKIGVGRTSWVATYGQDLVFVPTQYKGNVALVNSLFKGKELEVGL